MDDNLFYNIELTARRVKHFGQTQLNKHGFDITIEQWLVLKLVSENEGITQTEIIQQLLKDKPTISRMVKSLVEKGIIAKTGGSGDQRSYSLILSKKGKKLIDQMIPIIEEIRSQGLGSLSEKEIQASKNTLKKIRNNLGY